MKQKVIVALKAVVIHQGKILILKRSSNEEVGADEWETVGGKLEFGEHLEAALIREVKEEAGLNVTVEKLLYAVTFLTDPQRQIVLLSYLCRTDELNVTLSSEHSAFLWATKSQLIELLPKAIIEDFHKHHILTIDELL